ncbi:MAG: hypothetical protein IT393_10180 [Nitrospirae bacterium]|nr:hypothetical protein [Nitrospirota bacterium]
MLFTLIHIIHLLTVIIWIGGLSFITIIVIPMLIKWDAPLQKALTFQSIEHKFAPIARVYNLITGATGFIMVYLTGWHKLYFTAKGLPLLIMTVIWLIWFVMLFGLEPLIVKKMLDNMAKNGVKMEIEAVFARMNLMHWVLLTASLVASIAGIVFAHSYF